MKKIFKKIMFWFLLLMSIIVVLGIFTMEKTSTNDKIIGIVMTGVILFVWGLYFLRKNMKKKEQQNPEKYAQNMKKMKKTILISAISLFFISFIGIIIAINVIQPNYDDVDTIEIDTLYLAVQENEANAISLYQNKHFKLTGTIDKIYENNIVLSGSSNIYSIDFHYQNSYRKQVNTLSKGDIITIGGKFKQGVFGNWIVEDGVIIQVTE